MPTEVAPRKRWVKSPIFPVKGLSDFRYPSERLTPDKQELLENVNLTEAGTARRNFGSAKYNSAQITSAKAFSGLRQQTFKGGTELEFETAADQVYTDNGSTRTNITGTLSLTDSADSRYRFEFIKDQLVATNGTDETWVNSGSGASTALAGVSWTTCEDLVVHQNLLFALSTTEGGVKFPTRIRWCDVDVTTFEIDITTWPTGNRYAVFEDGAPIVGGVDAFGRLLVIKQDGVYPISVNVEQGFIEAFADRPLRGGFTPIAKSSIVTHPSFGVFLIAKDGAYVIRPDMSFELVTRDIQKSWNAFNQGRIQYAQSWIRETDHQVRTLISSASNSSGHDKVLVYDWETGDVWIDTPNDVRGFTVSMRQSNVEYDFVGTNDGYALRSNDSAQVQDNGANVSWTIRSSPNDLGLPGVDKEMGMITTFFIDKVGVTTVNLDVFRNEKRQPKKTFTLDIGLSQTYDAGLLYDLGFTYGGNETPQNTSSFINRLSETIQPEWTGVEDLELTGYQIQYRVTE